MSLDEEIIAATFIPMRRNPFRNMLGPAFPVTGLPVILSSARAPVSSLPDEYFRRSWRGRYRLLSRGWRWVIDLNHFAFYDNFALHTSRRGNGQ